jgi:hypothetical protein
MRMQSLAPLVACVLLSTACQQHLERSDLVGEYRGNFLASAGALRLSNDGSLSWLGRADDGSLVSREGKWLANQHDGAWRLTLDVIEADGRVTTYLLGVNAPLGRVIIVVDPDGGQVLERQDKR